MTAPSEKAPFTVLFVQGAWHREAHGAPLVSAVKSAGYDCEIAPFPSNILTAANFYAEPEHPDFTTPLTDPRTLPDGHADSTAVRKKLSVLIEEKEKTVLILAHSYGGWVASEAADQKLSRTQRAKEGKKGGVLGIFYVCAFPLPVGQSMLGYLEGTPLPALVAHPSGLITLNDPETALFHELSTDEQQHWKDLLVPLSGPSGMTKLEYAGYLHVPCGYLLCENDRFGPIIVQERLVEEMRGAGATVKTWRRPLGHEPPLAWTQGLTDLVLEFGNGLV